VAGAFKRPEFSTVNLLSLALLWARRALNNQSDCFRPGQCCYYGISLSDELAKAGPPPPIGLAHTGLEAFKWHECFSHCFPQSVFHSMSVFHAQGA
jgi:hypothetical protein